MLKALVRPLKEFVKKPPRWMYRVEKRFRFVISVGIMTVAMLFATFFFFDKAWLFIPLFILISYCLVFYSILEGVEKLEWIMLFLMPVIFTVSLYFFYFLFPVRWLTRLPFVAIYAISFYALLLTSNIFNVGAEKNLQLYRAAFSVNYFFQTFVAFLLFNILFSLRQDFIFNGLAVGVLVLPLAVQLLWSIKLDLALDRQIVLYGLFLALLLMQLGIFVSFVPFRSSVASLLLAASYYSFTGLTTAYLDNRLFKNTVREYLFVLAFVFAISILTIG
ncbi:hypothetical protein A3G67_02850 [Candidatus Roizmanbacteria bacterium RIFCSPLOWO2_12_FULL_40_12]|uniref:Uncharacterized protein n=1 Tax=Candidatus Roizmanbacteria bacterium RIFCSPLOWO2_01_FULL_40_42 TaxID=1802066 RepID=A0A1F7J2N4_9BACT|nr:MAG: hypothetical protein A2779_00380 [Candidatus Roizmanbacteria bacterium RIFCSPHIGHO2_01_FULL_40_98]OGK27516.1 MAG: hypothetical protein A3C31_03535 [Candidatus Roizmanbacteria bacterium RIFCSPHIGHO2_02_FULL_40_53]OGK30272.1 MAG: hypothetical protein A2W49_01020 [Candidatus Roizmanbacteria bacterium RIFCSPHIGHO2_12_41_18]OGK37128.1 MAG: hypothetical protein A3E69_01575 [Candidatus Roizmanbacteria bacterium RIFCSPHIGHO2_12_FULL_40_130]OGK49878.1 MAG: hypothetical protein A3B50_03775 [Candi